jgi:hypothetical protein
VSTRPRDDPFPGRIARPSLEGRLRAALERLRSGERPSKGDRHALRREAGIAARWLRILRERGTDG